MEKTQSLRFCLGVGEAWLKDPNLEVCVTFSVSRFIIRFLMMFEVFTEGDKLVGIPG